MQATIYNLAGEEAGSIELDDAVFGVTPNMAVIQQAVLRQQANARQGTHETKTRAHVRGGGRKPWRQKGTGRARQGSTRSPQWAHGGVVFGPHVRSYEQDMPRKMRRLAIRGVLSSKLADGRLLVVEGFDEMEPRTKVMLEALGKLNVGTESALIMLPPDAQDNLKRAAGNLPRVTLMQAGLLSVLDMLKHEFIIMPRASVEIVQAILGSQGGRRKFSLNKDGDNGATTPTAEATPPKAAPAKSTKEKSKKAEATAAPTKKAKKAEAEADKNVAFERTAIVADTAESTMLADTEADAPAKAEPEIKAKAPAKRKSSPKSKTENLSLNEVKDPKSDEESEQ